MSKMGLQFLNFIFIVKKKLAKCQNRMIRPKYSVINEIVWKNDNGFESLKTLPVKAEQFIGLP